MEEKKPTKEDTARVKGLGCLRDKRYDDVFNVRVITGYGKLDTAGMRAISDAAERFGTGEVALTTRQTVEIQGVKYEKLDELFAFLGENGLSTGGTGAKVRPVVSCKGTTCVYGLVDTYSLAKKISEKFYFEMHGTALPHKFKIAVGGCPNNCVKPQLNDLGVVGTRRPALDTEKCRGCKVCQVESACPVGAAVKIDDRITDRPRKVSDVRSLHEVDTEQRRREVSVRRGNAGNHRIPRLHRRQMGQRLSHSETAPGHPHDRGRGYRNDNEGHRRLQGERKQGREVRRHGRTRRVRQDILRNTRQIKKTGAPLGVPVLSSFVIIRI